MSRRRNARDGDKASRRKAGTDPLETRINAIIAASKPVPGPIRAEVLEALDRLGALFRIDKPLVEALKSELSIRLLTAETPDVYIFRPGKRPERAILLNFAERDGRIRVHPAAVFEECAHALRGLFHPFENTMVQEFFGALGPVLALESSQRGPLPPFEAVEVLLEMRGDPSRLETIPDTLAARLRNMLPPGALDGTEPASGNGAVAAAFLKHSAEHILPGLVARSMADTGHLAQLMAGNHLMSLPAKEIAGIMTEYGRICATDPAWMAKFTSWRKVCGYYLKPDEPKEGLK